MALGIGLRAGQAGHPRRGNKLRGPIVDVMPSVDGTNAVIGSQLTGDLGAATPRGNGNVSITARWLVAGIAEATTPAFTPQPSQDGSNLVFEVTYTETGGPNSGAVVHAVNLGNIRYAAPTLANVLDDQIFPENSGVQSFDVTAGFGGQDLSFAVTSGPGIISNAGVYSVDTDALAPQSVSVTIAASNSGGSVSTGFQLTIDAVIVPVTQSNPATFSGVLRVGETALSSYAQGSYAHSSGIASVTTFIGFQGGTTDQDFVLQTADIGEQITFEDIVAANDGQMSGPSEFILGPFTVAPAPDIAATIPPTTSALSAGQSVGDMTDFEAMISPSNFSSNAGSIQSVVVSFQGAISSETDPVSEGQQAGFSVLVTNSVGTQRTFTTALITVPYIAPSAAGGLSGQTFANGSGTQAYDISTDFTGSALSYAVSTGPGTVNNAGLYSVNTDAVGEVSTTVVITASNPGGSASSSFSLNIIAGTISAAISPSTTQVSAGESVSDMVDYAAMVAAGNFSSDVAPISSVVVTLQGDASSASDPLAEGETASFSVLVTDAFGNQASFSTTLITVPYNAPIAAGELVDRTFGDNSGLRSYDVSGDFTGTALFYAVVSGPGSINSATGLYSVDTNALGVQSDTPVVISATNPGGSATSGFSLTISGASQVADLSVLTAFSQEGDGDVPISYTIDIDSDVHFVLSDAATQPTASQILAGQDHTGTAAPERFTVLLVTTGGPVNESMISTTLDASYYIHAVVSGGNDGDVITATGSPIAILTAPPALSAPGSGNYSSTSATGSVVSNSSRGTLYAGVWPDGASPTEADIIAGTGAIYSTTDVSPNAGSNSFSASGLTATTAYQWHFHQVDDLPAASNIATSATFSTTDQAPVLMDQFNRADEQLSAGSDWILRDGGAAALQIVSNQLRSQISGGAFGALVANSNPLANDQEAEVTITGQTGTGENITGVFVRGSTGTACYALHIDMLAGWIRIMEGSAFNVFNTVTLADAATQTGETFTAPFSIKLRAVGTSLTAYINNVEITGLATTDATHSSGDAGIWTLYCDGTNATTLDDFISGDV